MHQAAGQQHYDVRIEIPSPAGPKGINIILQSEGASFTASLGDHFIPGGFIPLESLVGMLEAIAEGELVVFSRRGKGPEKWDVLDARDADIESVLSERFRWGEFAIRSWSGKVSGVVRLFSM